MSITPVRELEPKKRIGNFDEVCLGYNQEEAVKEASRCIQCKNPTCMDGCPAKVNIPKFIKQIADGKNSDALATIKETNNLPGVCGRVCPQEAQCEQTCVLNKAEKAIAIGKLERFAADNGGKSSVPKIKKTMKKIAVIGSGPASLSCAADLALKGFDITMYEALHKTGGVLRYGIPAFRLPRKILDDEIDFIKKLGVKIVVNTIAGKTIELGQLSEDFDAVFLGTGAGCPRFMDIPGEDLNGVYSANEFLTRVNLMNAHEFPKYKTPVKKGGKVVVVGGGNVAMDAARTAKRIGSDVTLVYRRSFDEMPARIEEVHHAQEEEIELLMLTNPIRILGSENVEGVECVQMRLGEEDDDGRRSPIPIQDTEFTINCDQVIIAIGATPNQIIAKTKEIMTGGWNKIIVNEDFRTSKENIFAGGDAISGSATVIKAIGDGKKAAAKIEEFLKEKKE